MTTLIKIINESEPGDGAHDIKIIRNEGGSPVIIKPKESRQVHIWEGVTLTISEVENTPQRRGGLHGYGAFPPVDTGKGYN